MGRHRVRHIAMTLLVVCALTLSATNASRSNGTSLNGTGHLAASPLSQGRVGPWSDAAARERALLIHRNTPLFQANRRCTCVALSFDDGPGPYTAGIVATLRSLHAPATFFEIGRQVAPYRSLVVRMAKWGFVIGDHTWSHPDLVLQSSAQITSQIAATRTAIAQASGQPVVVMRPPYGAQNARVRTLAGRQGMLVVLWSVDPRDWAMPGTQAIISGVVWKAYSGSIVILHDGGGDRSETAAALGPIVRGLRARGLRLVTIAQMLELGPPLPIPPAPKPTPVAPAA